MHRSEEVRLTQTDQVHTLSEDNQSHEAQKDPRNEAWCVVSVHIDDIAEADEVKLTLTTTSCSIDGKEDRPCDEAATEADEY